MPLPPQFAVAWQRLRQLQEEDATLEATVMSVNRGGLLVEAASLRGFIPTSHVSVVRHHAVDTQCTRTPCVSCPHKSRRQCFLPVAIALRVW